MFSSFVGLSQKNGADRGISLFFGAGPQQTNFPKEEAAYTSQPPC